MILCWFFLLLVSRDFALLRFCVVVLLCCVVVLFGTGRTECERLMKEALAKRDEAMDEVYSPTPPHPTLVQLFLVDSEI